MKLEKIIVLSLIVLTGLSPIQRYRIIPLSTLVLGTVGDSVPNPSTKVGQLQDKAYTYTGADIVVNDYDVHIDDYVTIVVIDNGLTDEEWKALEQNPEANVDIIGFLTEAEDGSTKYITNPDDPYLDDQVMHGHGFAVISALAAIARDVKVIFVDIDELDYDPYGFEYGEYKIWEWIDNNQESKDIDIISWSMHYNLDFTTSSFLQKWDSLISKDVIMITGAGKFGNYLNVDRGIAYKYQSYYTEWYAVGSIDHETRSYGSTKNQKSWFSPWYESYTAGNHIINWLEPGNGVPALEGAYYDSSLKCYRGTWKYSEGTSISTPYLAAIIALIITGYHEGIGSSTDPSLQKVIDILQYASSRSSFDQKMGYGYVDAYIAYGKAYTEGKKAA
ncbi:MAG: S8 family serine peptidase [Candidatus Heimdallarchaeaceae archaeon]